MARLSAWIVIGSLLVVAFGAPAVEVAGGNWPTASMKGRVTLESLLTGGAASEVEEALEDNARISEAVRPRYNELMFLTLGVVSPRVVVGEDDWLFLAARVGGRPTAELERLSQTCAEIRALVDWFEGNGTHVIFEFIPRKQSLYPEKVPDRNPPFEPVYDELLAAMQAAGLRVVDLGKVLDPAEGLFYLTNDDHWNHEGASRSAAAVADEIRALYPSGKIPGRRVKAEIRKSDPVRFAGNLVDMLGFTKGGFMEERFTVDRERITAYAPGKPRVLRGSEEPEAITVLGTSFSGGFHTASLLTGYLGRRVEDRSKAGLAGGYRMADLCRELLLGERPFPEVLVWEFPEDFLVQSVPYFVDPVNAVVDAAEHFPYEARPLPVKRRTMRGIRVTEEDDEELSGTCITGKSELVYTLSEPLPGDGTAVLAFRLLVSVEGEQNTAWDTGKKVGSGGRDNRLLKNSQFPHQIMVPLRSQGGRDVHRIHIQPLDRFGRFQLSAPEVWQ